MNKTSTSPPLDRSITEDAHPTDIYLGEEYIGAYSDYRMYDVNFSKDQKIRVRLEIQSGADFDLFVFSMTKQKGGVHTQMSLVKTRN